jgi:uncharacterized protein
MTTNFDKKSLIDLIVGQLKINKEGIHGTSHWARVRHHGLTVGKERDADLLVIELFSFLHDSQRENEWRDPLHGTRAADFAVSLNSVYYDLNSSQLDKLCYAMTLHSDGHVHADATIQSCWDADRLDLGRADIYPSEKFLSNEAAKHIASAYEWSLQR